MNAGSIKILPEIPPIKLSVGENGGYAQITWELLGDEYAIRNYDLRRGDRPDSLKIYKSFDSNQNRFTDDSVLPGHIYYYDLIAWNSEDAHRGSREAVSFTPSISIDIHAWEGTTKTLIEANSKLFISSLKEIVSTVIDNGKKDALAADDKKLLLQVKAFLEELADE